VGRTEQTELIERFEGAQTAVTNQRWCCGVDGLTKLSKNVREDLGRGIWFLKGELPGHGSIERHVRGLRQHRTSGVRFLAWKRLAAAVSLIFSDDKDYERARLHFAAAFAGCWRVKFRGR